MNGALHSGSCAKLEEEELVRRWHTSVSLSSGIHLCEGHTTDGRSENEVIGGEFVDWTEIVESSLSS